MGVLLTIGCMVVGHPCALRTFHEEVVVL